MKALILNSGRGTRMGNPGRPKCMTPISENETILSRQLNMLAEHGITEIVMTTGAMEKELVRYTDELDLPLHIISVYNPEYAHTNYIYSIYCARAYLCDDDILLMHGDLVFDETVLNDVLRSRESCMTVSSTAELPEKDFKAVIRDGYIQAVGIEFFDNAAAAQPLYLLRRDDWAQWLQMIVTYCESGDPAKRSCYAEHALNELPDKHIVPLDVKNRLCAEIDNPQDLEKVTAALKRLSQRTVYMCFSTDIIHSAHIVLIRHAVRLGRLMIGVMTDEVVCSYKRFPLMPFAERKAMFEQIAGVEFVIPQDSLSYQDILIHFEPDIVVHGDDWTQGVQRPIRDEVTAILAGYGGMLVEYPYREDAGLAALENRAAQHLSMPDMRRRRLKQAMAMKGLVSAIEAHSGLTGLIAEKTVVYQDGAARQFDAMWISSLCDSAAKGKPDIGLVDMTSRFRTVDDIMEVTTKPIIFDGDSGGLAEHFVYTVRTLERMGVSMVIIEDKTGLKKNSLFGTEVTQTQAPIAEFCEKIRAGKQAQKTSDFMICARIESLILEKGLLDALTRASAYVKAGADAIMIHSRKRDPAEIFAFVNAFRASDTVTPLVVVPTAFNTVTEEEFKKRGVNIVIYANQLIRSGFPAMQHAAEMILTHHRALECDEICMPFQEIIRLIPEE